MYQRPYDPLNPVVCIDETNKQLIQETRVPCDNILDVAVVTLDELGEVDPDSICLITLRSSNNKTEIYPLLFKVGFGDVIPVVL